MTQGGKKEQKKKLIGKRKKMKREKLIRHGKKAQT